MRGDGGGNVGGGSGYTILHPICYVCNVHVHCVTICLYKCDEGWEGHDRVFHRLHIECIAILMMINCCFGV